MSDKNNNKNSEKKIKYSAEYISYVENGESAAVFITRDIATTINTKGKWVDVLSLVGHKDENIQWDFRQITIELLPRLTNPVYPQNASDADKKYITWQTAHDDIEEHRINGVSGEKYIIRPRLKKENQSKLASKKAPEKSKWTYEILSVEKIY